MGRSCPCLLPLPLKEHLSLAFLEGSLGFQEDPAYRCLCPIRVLLNGVHSRASTCMEQTMCLLGILFLFFL